MLKKLLLGGVALLAFSPAFTQITQRERPVEWKQLVEGGRFMDRFPPYGKKERWNVQLGELTVYVYVM